MKPTALLLKYWGMVNNVAHSALKVLVLIVSLMILYKHYQIKTTTKINIQVNNPVFKLLGPHDEIKFVVNDVYNKLINIKDFRFLINPKLCQEFHAGLFLIVIIPSKPDNYRKRSTIRNTWGQVKDFAKILFLMGQTNVTAVKHSVEEESKVYGDILLGSFVDAYRNMTYKHLMGLKWVAHHCGSARYVLKVDDDVLVNIRELWRFLVRELSPWGARGLLLCNINIDMPVIRDPTAPERKWRVLKEEYEGEFYPPYCSGELMIYSRDVLLKILESTQRLRYFWIDDAHITGFAVQNIGVVHTDMGHWYMPQERYDKLRRDSGNLDRRFLFGQIQFNTENWERISDL